MPRGNFKGKHSTRAQKVEFVRSRPDLADDKALARAMRDAGLYARTMGVTDISFQVPLLRAQAAQAELPLPPDVDSEVSALWPAGAHPDSVACHLKHVLIGYRDWVLEREDIRRFSPGSARDGSWRAGMAMAKRDLAGRRAVA